MAFMAQTHPIRTIRRIITPVSVYMMDLHAIIATASFTVFPKENDRFFNPDSPGIFFSACLSKIVAFFGAVSGGFSQVRWYFNCLFTMRTNNFLPFFYTPSFPEKRVVTASSIFGNVNCVSSIVTKNGTVFRNAAFLLSARVNIISVSAIFTLFKYFFTNGLIITSSDSRSTVATWGTVLTSFREGFFTNSTYFHEGILTG